MIPTLLSIAAPVAIMIACGVLGGFFEALADARKILANEYVEHKWSAVIRLWNACWISALITLWIHQPWWTAIPLALIGLSAFNPVFRWTMNKKRGKHACYISPKSNFYDDSYWSFFMIVVHDWTVEQTALWRADHDKAWRDKPKFWETHDITIETYQNGSTKGIFMTCILYRKIVLQSGRLAYILELSCLITSALLYGTGVILSNTN